MCIYGLNIAVSVELFDEVNNIHFPSLRSYLSYLYIIQGMATIYYAIKARVIFGLAVCE